MMTRSPWLGVAALGCALWLQHRAQVAEVARLSSQVRVLGEQVAAARQPPPLAAWLQASPGVAAEPRDPPAPAGPGGASAPARLPSAPGPKEADGDTGAAELAPPLVAVQNQFLGERVDPGWAGAARRGLEERLVPLLREQGALQRVECRGSLCRLETVHGNVTDAQRFLSAAFQEQSSWTGSLQAEPPQALPDGRTVAVVYLRREE